MTRLFGTDGIRGVANQEPLTTDLALRLGRQLSTTLREHHGVDRIRLVVGRDTRLSGPLLESALVAGAHHNAIARGAWRRGDQATGAVPRVEELGLAGRSPHRER